MKKMWSDNLEMEGPKMQRIKNLRLRSNCHSDFLRYTFYFLLFTFNFYLLTSCQQKAVDDPHSATVNETYTCPMHPHIIETIPGTCPICGMDLVLQHPKAIKMEVDASLSNLLQPTNEAVISNIETINVSGSSLTDTLYLNGTVNFNTNNLKTMSSRVNGRIEKLYVKYTFQKVNEGQLLMEIYSPELASAQQELLYLKSKGDFNLMEQAKSKLRLLGVSENQLNQIIKSGKVNYRIPVYSTASGYLIDQNTNLSLPQSADEAVKPMDTDNNPLTLLEGAYVKTGDILFKLFNDAQVWGTFYVNAQQINNISKNQTINIQSGSTAIHAKVNLIQPYYINGQSFSALRVYIPNDKNAFKIGELLKGEIIVPSTYGLWVPAEAVYQLGNRNIVFTKQKDVLKPKEVMVSRRSKSKVLIKTGLSEGDEIARNASYLIDTESFIKIIN